MIEKKKKKMSQKKKSKESFTYDLRNGLAEMLTKNWIKENLKEKLINDGSFEIRCGTGQDNDALNCDEIDKKNRHEFRNVGTVK